ncbi:MAG: hypothetical protein WBK96_03195 [Candidatus Manganitrophaceae bacterium]
MKIKKLWPAFGLVLFALSISYAEEMPGSSQHSTSDPGHRNVVGTVTKTTTDMISVEMTEGTVRNFTVKAAAREGITKLKTGDRVLLEFDEGNQIINIIDIGERHQLVKGAVMSVDQVKQMITLKLKDGTSQSFKMKAAMAGKMNNIKTGADVTLMIDQHNKSAMDAHID